MKKKDTVPCVDSMCGNHRRLGGSRKPKLLVLSSWGTGTWIQLLYFIAFSARVKLLHARPVLQSDFNASLIISDLTRGVPLFVPRERGKRWRLLHMYEGI